MSGKKAAAAQGAVREAARRLWQGLSEEQRGELGDQLVLGGFDWMDWMEEPPPKGFLVALDEERIRWEQR